MKSEDWFKLYIENTDKRLKSIEEKIDSVLEFKWKIFGGVAVTSFLVTLGFQILAR